MNNKLGDFIRTYRSEKDLSLRQFGTLSGISHTHIDSIERGADPRTGKSVKVTNDLIEKIANATNQEPAYIFSLSINEDWDNKPDVVRVPILGLVKAGIPSEAIQEFIDWEEIPADWLRGGKEYFALEISGDSMYPRMEEGDVIIVLKQQWCNNGDIMVVRVNGDEATVKKVIKQDNGILLIAFNPEYEPIFYTHKQMKDLPVEYLGKVVELRGKF